MKNIQRDAQVKSSRKADALPENPSDLNPSIARVLDEIEEGKSSSRRSFLRLAGFSFAATAGACSRGKPQTALPLVQTAPEMIPGRAYWVATTSMACGAGCGALVRCRDGRPVKLEGNPGHPVSQGGLCPACQASLLGLYDSKRLQGARGPEGPLSEELLDLQLRDLFQNLRSSGKIRFLTGTVNSPSTLSQIQACLEQCSDGRHVMYDGISRSAILEAHQMTHGVRGLPRYRLDRAEVLVSFGADFLSTWVSPVEFAKQYARARRPEGSRSKLLRHWQFEANLSLSGGNADVRTRIAPWEENAALTYLSDRLAGQERSNPGLPALLIERLDQLLKELSAAKGAALVISDSNEVRQQLLVNQINQHLNGYGRTLDVSRPSLQWQGSDRDLHQLRQELENGGVDLLIVQGCNPVYDLPDWEEALKKAGHIVYLSRHEDETSPLATWLVSESHDLERWDDHQPVEGVYSFSQPLLPGLFAGRSLRHCLASWRGAAAEDVELLKKFWREKIYPTENAGEAFEAWFDRNLQRGVYAAKGIEPAGKKEFQRVELPAPDSETELSEGKLQLVLYSNPAMQDGRHAHNPWLHELPDPVTKVCWDNYLSLAPETASKLRLETGDRVRVEGEIGSFEIPVLVQVGLHPQIAAVALGYGRKGTDRFADIGPEWMQSKPTVAAGGQVGQSVSSWIAWKNQQRRFSAHEVSLVKLGGSHKLACTQDHHRMELPPHLAPKGGEVRDVVRVLPLAEVQGQTEQEHGSKHHVYKDLWPDDHPYEGKRWGMAVDLNACTGCSSCVIACQVENNVPVVGKDEVLRHREMSWIRIDRYFEGEGDQLQSHHQPVMCQHCSKAPCETVCPVLATTHSEEGLNQQVYNRCVGTRYCANNCPYKVRRFNWFDYPREDQLQNLSLNPDVTVRSRGVMEKCTLCVQRIQDAKAEARRNGRPLEDGEIQMACQQSCPSQAIVFGDLNDPESLISKFRNNSRSYDLLEELDIQPGVHYLAKVRKQEDRGDHHRG